MWHQFEHRLRRAVALDDTVYRELARDEHATGQAVAVVMGSATAEGVGRLLGEGLTGLLASLGQGCLAWTFWLLGIAACARALGLSVGLAPLFRALGFAAAPFALGLLEPIPALGVLVLLVKWGLGLAAAVTALREVLQIQLGRALVLCACGLGVAFLLSVPVAWLTGG